MIAIRRAARLVPPLVVAALLAAVIVRAETATDAPPIDTCPRTSELAFPKIDLSVATAEELERLPRIGPALAARIVADRLRNGPFRTVDELDRVPGIGPATVELLRPLVVARGPADAGAWQRE